MINKIISKKGIFKLLYDFSALGGISFYIFMIFFFLILKRGEIAVQLFLLFVVGSIIGYGIKIFYKKARPLKNVLNNKKEIFIQILDEIDSHSFPSNHSLRIILLSLVMINLFKNVYVTMFFVILSLAVCGSRVILKRHYFVDVIGGIILGVFCYFGMFFVLF